MKGLASNMSCALQREVQESREPAEILKVDLEASQNARHDLEQQLEVQTNRVQEFEQTLVEIDLEAIGSLSETA